ncbi:helix-turn-helix domain-containing protein [Actinoplanes sp. NPDC051851]|uniref:TetR/AcrR family transcriptional regulator n=1 Tax=Actinoplanes sp. NPDC051851 TaxID=3154753 RepID=UPI00343F7791
MTREPALRADARRNHHLIITTAAAVFAEDGLDVPMEAIARRAGVGVGTLYRRFPDRGELIAAVAAHTFRAVLEDVRAAAAAAPTPWDALTRLLSGSENLRLTVHLAFLSPHTWTRVHSASESREIHDEMMAALETLVNDARREGSIRADVGTEEVLGLVSWVLAAPASAAESVPRWLELVLDGLRAHRY